MEKEQRVILARILASAILLVCAILIEHFGNWQTRQLLLFYLIPYLIVGYDVIAEAFESITHGEPLDEDFLMTVATIGALAIGFLPGAENQFPEAVFVMLFFQVGELFEDIAEGKSRQSISQLMNLRPDITHLVAPDNTISDVSPDDACVGDTIQIRPGETVPLDGVILQGSSSLNTVALTGESVPRQVAPSDEVISGCVNTEGVLLVKVTKPWKESTAAKILNLVENATEHKSHSERFITRFARIYTPVVVVLALLVALLPPLLIPSATFATWLYRALTFLVVSCPCALVISVPLTFFSGIGGASRKGILIKGANFIESLARVRSIAFDKTGTITHGVFEVTAIHPQLLSEQELLHLAAHVERFSSHPIAISLRQAYPNEQDDCSVSDVREIAGQGVTALVNGQRVAVGNTKLMTTVGADFRDCHKTGTIVHVAINGDYAGHIVVSDKIKDDAQQAILALKKLHLQPLVMLTGDKSNVAAAVASQVGINTFHTELLPDGKVAAVEQLLSNKQRASDAVAFVGDGINDAPVLARADVGIAMGALGSDAAIEAADVVLMDDKPSKIATAIQHARHTLAIARQNTWFAIAIKLAVLILAFLGLASMSLAVFADVGVTVLAVLNAMRALK